MSKRPVQESLGELNVEVGSFDHYTGSFDLGGPSSEGSDVAHRLTGLVRDGGTQQDHVDDGRYFWRPRSPGRHRTTPR